MDIHQGFEAFIHAARQLEESYSELQTHAAAIDLQLTRTNDELQKTLLEREMVFTSLPVGLLSLDASGTERWCNPEGRRLCGLVAAHGTELQDLPEGDWEHERVNLRLQRTRMADGGTLITAEDRSRVVRLEREVDRLDRLAGLSELALGIAHEIKNPLNGVMGFATLLSRTDDTDKQRRYAARISDGLEQVDSIVKGLLAFARPAASAAKLVDILPLIHRSATAAGVPTGCLEVRFVGGAQPDLPVDGNVLGRVLGNLFRNASEAVPGRRARLQVRVELIDRELALTVRDDGPGVAAADAQRIFKPFVSTKDQGHGLGLALACRVLAFFGGRIELLNPGRPGAEFRVTMPLCVEPGVEASHG
ncbi:MAG: hypothetical protein KDC87_13040 [Planctomycetes bacterium]|nr:hypothetical protein [Planctomycetota bacterium]